MSFVEARTLHEFMRTHAVWDPMPLWDGHRYLLYVLAMDREKGLEQGNFFLRENAIHAFESVNLRNWRYLGVAFEPQTDEERLCAGNPLYHDGRYWFFGSSTIEQYDEQHLDQRLFLAVSDDGIRFEKVPEFSLEPDPSICPHQRFHPVDGRMLFAWRDPWPVYDRVSKRLYLFVCSGGKRWGCDPNVILASADTPIGPFKLHGSVLELPRSSTGDVGFGEIERINVLEHEGRYLLTFSCWQELVNPTVLQDKSSITEPITDSSVYLAEAESISGPYRFDAQRSPVVEASYLSGFYGTTFFSRGQRDSLAIGWNINDFRVDFLQAANIEIVQRSLNKIGKVKIYWPRHRVFIKSLVDLNGATLSSLREIGAIWKRMLGRASRIYVNIRHKIHARSYLKKGISDKRRY